MGKFILCLSLVQKLQQWLVGHQRKGRGNERCHDLFPREDRAGSIPKVLPMGSSCSHQTRQQGLPKCIHSLCILFFPEHTSRESVHAKTCLPSTKPGCLSTLRISGCFSCILHLLNIQSIRYFKCKVKPNLYKNSREVLFLVSTGILQHPRNTHLST